MIEHVFFPLTPAEAIEIMHREPDSAFVAGGTDLMNALQEGKVNPKNLVSLDRLTELKSIIFGSEHLIIGALATHQSIFTNDVIAGRYTAIAEAAGQIGSWQVRNLATIGGNLVSAVPSADIAPPLLALNAKLKLVGCAGERTLPLKSFFVGPMKTVLTAEELMVEIFVPALSAQSGSCYLKLGPRSAVDLALVSTAASLSMENGRCSAAGIALGAVAPTPLKVREAEQALIGTMLTETDIEKAAQIAAAAAKPISDHRASAAYRRRMIMVLTKRALLLARERAFSAERV